MTIDSTAIDCRVVDAVFIVGYMHSGTSLLLEVLSRVDGVAAAPGETRFFEMLAAWERQFPDLGNRETRDSSKVMIRDQLERGFSFDDLSSDAHGRTRSGHTDGRALADMFASEALSWCRERRGRVFVEKTPTHVHHLSTIFAAFPNSVAVAITRDPRDVLSSKKIRLQRSQHEGTKQASRGFDPVLDSLGWRVAVADGSAAAHRHPGRVLRIRYEDLVTDPEPVLRGVLKHIGLPWDSRLLDLKFDNAAKPSGPERAIDARSVGQWRTSLTKSEAVVIELMCGAQMSACQYERSRPDFASVVLASAYLGKSLPHLLQRIWNRYRLGGWRWLLIVLEGYLYRFRRLLHRESARE